MTLGRLALRVALACATLAVAADASPRPAARHPYAAAQPVAAGESRFSGRVRERLAAGSYSYLRVERDDGSSVWAVTLGAVAPDAELVRVQVVRRAERFESPRLRRTFSPLLFSIVRKETVR